MNHFLQNKKIPALINALIVVVMGYACSVFIWKWFTPASSVGVAGGLVNAQAVVNKPYARYGQKIANLHVFGKPEAPKPIQPVAPQPQEKAPQTRLNLTLKGVLAHSDQNSAFALIGQGSGSQKVYGVGDTLPGNAKLLEVYKDRVIIEYQQREETLFLEKRQTVNISNRPESTPPLPVAPLNTTRTQSFSPQRASQVREDLIANPAKVFNMMSIKPYRTPQGNVVGYQLSPKGDASLFNEAGLQDGDVVMYVNGISVTDTQGLNGLANESSYDVTILRQGSEVSLSVDFD